MHPRPIHRWKTFWFGILVLAFLGWAWVRSRERTDWIDLLRPDSWVLWVSNDSCIGVVELPFFNGHKMDMVWLADPEDDRRIWFPPWLHTINVTNKRSVMVAHWFLILLFFLPWTTWLVWRSRRMKRLAAPIATTVSPSQGDDS